MLCLELLESRNAPASITAVYPHGDLVLTPCHGADTAPPALTGLAATALGDGHYLVTGTVEDEYPEGVQVLFGAADSTAFVYLAGEGGAFAVELYLADVEGIHVMALDGCSHPSDLYWVSLGS